MSDGIGNFAIGISAIGGDPLADYVSLVTSEHRDAPKFIATLSAIVQPFVDGQSVLGQLPELFDLDNAVGDQLDGAGELIGRTRNLRTPLAGVYFSFGIDGLGFGEGTWLGPFDPVTGLVSLPDDTYRLYLKAAVAANKWDGTIPGAYDALSPLFDSLGSEILIQDNGDMSITLALAGGLPNAVELALFSGGYLELRPAGVMIRSYIVPSVPGAPFFAFGPNNDNLGGFGIGCWAKAL